MRSILQTSIFLFISFIGYSQNYWEQRDSVNGSVKAACVSFVLQGEGYILGGLDDLGFKRKMYSYNRFQDDWDNRLSIGGLNGDGLDRGSASSFSIGNKGYICLGQGQTNPYFKDLWEYDLATDSWSQKADFGGSSRRQAVSFTIDNIAYVGTGQDATGLKKDFFKYNSATNTWTQLNDFGGTARRQAVGFSMGSQGYVGTGDDGVLKNDFWMYVPSSDMWIQKANFPGTARAGATGWGIFPTGFIATGEDINFAYKKDVWEYNYFANVWVQRADFIGPARKNATSFVIDGIAFLGTGYNGVFLDDFYAYYGILGISEKDQFESKVYPNPSSGLVRIYVGNENVSDLDFKLYSAVGKEISEEQVLDLNENALLINTSSLLSGSYFYKINSKTDNKFSSGKLIVL